MIFTKNSIMKDNHIVMHKWEDLMMKKHAEVVCQNGGDILEIGFGMGIASNFIQNYNINSHTICENHPDVLEKLTEWSRDKDNITIVEGDWHKNRDKFTTYDGILFDTFDDMYIEKFKSETVYQLSKEKTNFCIWDNMGNPDSNYSNTITERMIVEKTLEDSWNYLPHDSIYLHKITIIN